MEESEVSRDALSQDQRTLKALQHSAIILLNSQRKQQQRIQVESWRSLWRRNSKQQSPCIATMIKEFVESIAFMPPSPTNQLPSVLPKGAIFRWLQTESSGRIPALLIPGPQWLKPDHFGQVRTGPVVLFSHGNAEDLGCLVMRFHHFSRRTNTTVLLYDYPGYSWGLKEPRGCLVTADYEARRAPKQYTEPTELSAYEAGTAAYRYATQILKVSPHDLILFGHSLGSGPTMELASTKPCSGVILLSPLRSAIRVATESVSLPFVDIFCNQDKIHKISPHVPVFVVHGTEDNVIPVSHGVYLQNLLDKSKQMTYQDGWFMRGYGHNDLETHPQYYARIRAFILFAASLKHRSPSELMPGTNNFANWMKLTSSPTISMTLSSISLSASPSWMTMASTRTTA